MTFDWDQMISTWCGELGRPYAEMWRLTPRVFALTIKGAHQAGQRNREDLALCAYLTEWSARQKKLPPFDQVVKMISPEAPKDKRNTAIAEQMYSHFKMYEAARKMKGEDD